MPVFYSERRVTESLNTWLSDECEYGEVEFDFSLPIAQKQVKALHAGERHGLQTGQAAQQRDDVARDARVRHAAPRLGG